MTGFINPVHILIVVAVVLIVFGPKRLPELASKLGTAWRELRDAVDIDGGGTRSGSPVSSMKALMTGEAEPPPANAPRTSALDRAAAAIVKGADSEGGEPAGTPAGPPVGPAHAEGAQGAEAAASARPDGEPVAGPRQ
jgi:sec-independent protein translocase protein TatA